jgi:nucleotide-binding universal stress UspA family protein
MQEERTDMFEHILVTLDGSQLAERVLPHAVTLARCFEARVTLLRVVSRVRRAGLGRVIDPLHWELRKSEAEAYLDQVRGHLLKVGLRVDQTVLEGKAASRIVEFVHEENVDLVVLSSHGQGGLSRWNINSVAQKVLLRAYVPVLIVRAYQAVGRDLDGLRYQRLLVPLDGSQRAEHVLPLASSLAESQEAQLLLAHVVDRPEVARRGPLTDEERELMDRLTALNREEGQSYMIDLQSRLSVDVRPHLLVGDSVAAALHELVNREDVDLVIVGAHGYSGEAQWPYGSVALNFIAYGTTPLLIVQDIPRKRVIQSEVERAVREQAGH